MRTIQVTHKSTVHRCLVDDDLFEELSKYPWIIQRHGFAFACQKIGGSVKTTYMHRLVTGAVGVKQAVLHLNGDRLDNRRENLKIVRPSQIVKAKRHDKKMGPSWTDEQTEILKAHAGKSDWVRAVSKQTGKSISSVRYRARQVGLPPGSFCFRWTPEMIQIVRERYTVEKSLSDLSDSIGVTVESIRRKAKDLGLKRIRAKGKDNARFTGYEEISGSYWCSVRQGAMRRGLEISISIEEAWQLFVDQNRCCALSGIVLEPPVRATVGTASLDRIDSTKGYVKGNVQWLHKNINMMKQELTDETFIDFCHAVSRHQSAEKP